MFTYKAEVIKVVDGDTVDVDVDLGFGTWVRNVRLRLNRIDAYETRLGKNTTQAEKDIGLLAKQYVIDNMTELSGEVEITTVKKGKYGRWIAEVRYQVDGNTVNLSDALVSMGYAIYKEY